MASTFSGMSMQQPYSAAQSTYGGYGGSVYTGTEMSGQRLITGGERVQSTRKISSTIITEEFLGPRPQDFPTREIEVPGPLQEEIKVVKVKEIREIEKKVPKYEIEWVERVVEHPRVEYVDREVERIQVQEVVREVKVPQWLDRPKEVIREVKKPVINYIEKVVEVPGPIVEVPKPYTVENKVHINRYTDKHVPVVVAQTIKPYIVEGAGNYDVDVVEYEPECVPVDVHVIKPVSAQIQSGGVVETMHRVIAVPAAQYNTILQQLNPHLSSVEQQKLPFLQVANGGVTFLSERVTYSQPQQGITIHGYTAQPPNTYMAGPAQSGAAGSSGGFISTTGGGYTATGGGYTTTGGYTGAGGYTGGGYTTSDFQGSGFQAGSGFQSGGGITTYPASLPQGFGGSGVQQTTTYSQQYVGGGVMSTPHSLQGTQYTSSAIAPAPTMFQTQPPVMTTSA